MKDDLKVSCPKCGQEFALAENLARPVIEAERAKARHELEAHSAEIQRREQEMLKAQADLAEAQKAVDRRQAEIDSAVEQKLRKERQELARATETKVAGEYAAKLKAAEDQLSEQKAKAVAAEKNELQARKEREALESEKRNLELTITRRLDEEREKLRVEGAATEQGRWKAKLAEQERELAAAKSKAELAEKAELSIRKEREAIAEQKRTLELDVQRRLDDEREKVRQTTMKEEEDAHRLKLAEKDKVIEDMRKQVEELRRKSEQGSQQLQGEVQELELEAILRHAFPMDHIEPVQKGRVGADILHTVIGPDGRPCGTILWESKRTANWSDGWLAKNRDDQREAKAHLGVIVTAAMPKNVETFARIQGVWVSSLRCAVPLAFALRDALVRTAAAQTAAQGREGKMETMYSYITGQSFRQRVSGIVESLIGMQTDLDAEKRATTRQWAKRQRQIELLMTSTAGMHGDLQGIVGKTMPEIEGLTTPLLAAGDVPEPPTADEPGEQLTAH